MKYFEPNAFEVEFDTLELNNRTGVLQVGPDIPYVTESFRVEIWVNSNTFVGQLSDDPTLITIVDHITKGSNFGSNTNILNP